MAGESFENVGLSAWSLQLLMQLTDLKMVAAVLLETQVPI
jgi:hypothetical protein